MVVYTSYLAVTRIQEGRTDDIYICLAEQTTYIFVGHSKEAAGPKMIHEENNVLTDYNLKNC